MAAAYTIPGNLAAARTRAPSRCAVEPDIAKGHSAFRGRGDGTCSGSDIPQVPRDWYESAPTGPGGVDPVSASTTDLERWAGSGMSTCQLRLGDMRFAAGVMLGESGTEGRGGQDTGLTVNLWQRHAEYEIFTGHKGSHY